LCNGDTSGLPKIKGAEEKSEVAQRTKMEIERFSTPLKIEIERKEEQTQRKRGLRKKKKKTEALDPASAFHPSLSPKTLIFPIPIFSSLSHFHSFIRSFVH